MEEITNSQKLGSALEAAEMCNKLEVENQGCISMVLKQLVNVIITKSMNDIADGKNPQEVLDILTDFENNMITSQNASKELPEHLANNSAGLDEPVSMLMRYKKSIELLINKSVQVKSGDNEKRTTEDIER